MVSLWLCLSLQSSASPAGLRWGTNHFITRKQHNGDCCISSDVGTDFRTRLFISAEIQACDDCLVNTEDLFRTHMRTHFHSFYLCIFSQEIMTTRYEMSKLEWVGTVPALCSYGGRTTAADSAAGFTPGFAGGGGIPFILAGLFPYGCYFAGWSRPRFRISSSAQVQMTVRGKLSFRWLTASSFPWNNPFWAFLSKENVLLYIKCCIYFFYVHVDLF